jgi:hydroxymethylpyrimidine kinase/phosphomethylpyrimidine kinase
VIALIQCYGMSVVTAVTSQNTQHVTDYLTIPKKLVQSQLEDVLEDIGADVVKTGMLPNQDIMQIVVEAIDKYDLRVVVDPVMVAPSGGALYDPVSLGYLRKDLLPRAYLATPNISEAKVLCDYSNAPDSVNDMEVLAKHLCTLGCKRVLLKGGHLPVDRLGNRVQAPDEHSLIVDVLCEDTHITRFTHPWSTSNSTHGSGCTLATAIACYISYGFALQEAVGLAIDYTQKGIKNGLELGKSNGPLCHMHSIGLPFKRYSLLKYR